MSHNIDIYPLHSGSRLLYNVPYKGIYSSIGNYTLNKFLMHHILPYTRKARTNWLYFINLNPVLSSLSTRESLENLKTTSMEDDLNRR